MADDSSPDFSAGERQSPRWQWQHEDLTPVEAGSRIVPAKIDSGAGDEYAALQLVMADLSFALECLQEADKIGLPDSEDVHTKALIFSAVVAYARSFATGVREVRLDGAFFADRGEDFDTDLHEYVIAVRNKHVAHSVNEFERCEAIGVMVGAPDGTWRPVGVGFTLNSTIGLSRTIVKRAIAQISTMLKVLTAEADRRRVALYEAFRAQYALDGKWEIAPTATFPSRENASKRRT